jgi:hypothetical protein
MPVSDDPAMPVDFDPDRIGRLEARLARLESHVGLAPLTLSPSEPVTVEAPPTAFATALPERGSRSGDFELELGQHWFALAGVAILTAGVMFLLSLPYAGLPPALPALTGFGLSAALLVASRFLPAGLSGAAGALRASGMALLGFSALRLGFFGPTPALTPDGPVELALLLAVTAINATLAVRQRSLGLTLLALAMAAAIALTAGATALVLVTVVGMAGIGVVASRRISAPLLPLAALGLIIVTYLGWATGNPLRTGAMHWVREPVLAPVVLLGALLALGVIPLLRAGERDDVSARVAAFSNCALGYGVYLLHTAAAFPARFAVLQLGAAVGLLGLAVAFFLRTESRVATFFYAMTGYAALSVAIMKLTTVPGVFVWLSVQSIVVVATAIGFRSRFIVVANFVIFALIVVAYMLAVKGETGISIGFGIVALGTARILNWKQHRLELQTDFMRNAYLASAFIIFPYALYHLVPSAYRALAWIALTGTYYLLTVVFRNQKYRWMGHGTLVLATVYVVALGVSRFSPVYRVLSFLALGAALLTVSLLFARSRRRSAENSGDDLPKPASG